MRVAIIGGGLSGLSAARALQAAGLEPVVFEASNRVGGMVKTERADGYVIEHGPDSIITTKPAALRLAETIGLGPKLIRTQSHARGAYVVARGKLERVPGGFQLVAPSNMPALVRSPILSLRGKARAGLEPFIPRRRDQSDESLGSFVRRRFGQEVLERLAQPMAGGIYGTDPEVLSLRTTMPRFLDMESKHGSLLFALARQVKERTRQGKTDHKASGARYGLFVSFLEGLGLLPETLAAGLEGCLRLQRPVAAIETDGTGYRVVFSNGENEKFDGVIAATTAWKVAEMLPSSMAPITDALTQIPFGSGAIVSLAYKRGDIPIDLDAAGFVVPTIENRALMASTWSSIKWAGRAPEGQVLLRAFLGGHHLTGISEWSEARLIAEARRNLEELMGIRERPILTRTNRWRRCMPRFHVGHLDRMDALDAQLTKHERFELAGNAYRGVGIPDAVASGEGAAARLLASAGIG